MGILIHPESHNLYNLVPFICTTQTGRNRIDILKQCYRLMAQGTWDAISVAELEKNISQTEVRYSISTRTRATCS